MIDSVPLIQNANDVQQINASIIAMKKASRELDEKIGKLNSLNSELDKKIALLDSGLNKEIEDRKEAIKSLDVASVGGSGKYISAISETDGKISATASDITPTVSSGNSQPVTSGGVAEAISVPTDAVLHYSFDEVPDYPDGSADIRLINNNTYNIQSGNFQFREFRSTTFTNSNGNVVLNISANSSGNSGAYIKGTYCANKIIKAKIKITALNGSIDISNGKGTNGVIVARYSTVGVYEFSLLQNPNAQYDNIYIATQNARESATVEILAIYIGDGSYSTPIIDNADGQWNSVSQSGIAVQGVSGKAYKCFAGQEVSIGNIALNTNFSVSIWVKTENATLNLRGEILRGAGQLIIRNGENGLNKFAIYIWQSGSTVTELLSSDLLPANIWTHIVVVKNNNVLKVYKNGEQSNNFQLSSNILHQPSENYSVADNSNTRTQSYDDLLIFDRALTEAEVMALYLNKANTPKYYSWADWKLSNT